MTGNFVRCTILAGLTLGLVSCGGDDDSSGSGSGVAANALSQCGVDKLDALSEYCDAYFAGGASAADLAAARAKFAAAWSQAEGGPAADGLACADMALTTDQAAALLDGTRDTLAAMVGAGPNGTGCAGDFFDAVGSMCASSLRAEARYYAEQGRNGAQGRRGENRESARVRFLPRADAALDGGCVDPDDVRPVSNAGRMQTDALVDALSFDVIAAANVDQDQYITVSPTGTIQYEGRGMSPVCMDGSDYHFFARRGSVNKLVMYYQGGGACWEKLTCSVPVCDSGVNPDGGDNPNNFSSGFADSNNPENPFRDWHSVFVSYCGCDIHFGDSAQDYVNGADDMEPLHVEHRGYQNAKVVEKWAREHFLAPEEVFVTGSSAGAYGAWFHAPLLHDVWPQAQFHVLADAGNGVITEDFLQNSFPNWNFEANLPAKYPEVQEVFDSGTGITGYTKVVAKEFPSTNWAHYSSAFDGGTGGQTGFYNVMLNDNDPLHALTWWEGSCSFNSVMREQVQDTADAVPGNYRYYIGTGARHTMWGSNKVYGIEDPDAVGNARMITSDLRIVDFVSGMLNSGPGGNDDDWSNFECEDCGLVLPGDPRPSPPEPPFEVIEGVERIVCE